MGRADDGGAAHELDSAKEHYTPYDPVEMDSNNYMRFAKRVRSRDKFLKMRKKQSSRHNVAANNRPGTLRDSKSPGLQKDKSGSKTSSPTSVHRLTGREQRKQTQEAFTTISTSHKRAGAQNEQKLAFQDTQDMQAIEDPFRVQGQAKSGQPWRKPRYAARDRDRMQTVASHGGSSTDGKLRTVADTEHQSHFVDRPGGLGETRFDFQGYAGAQGAQHGFRNSDLTSNA